MNDNIKSLDQWYIGETLFANHDIRTIRDALATISFAAQSSSQSGHYDTSEVLDSINRELRLALEHAMNSEFYTEKAESEAQN